MDSDEIIFLIGGILLAVLAMALLMPGTGFTLNLGAL